MSREPVARHRATILESLRVQLGLGLLAGLVLPLLLFIPILGDSGFTQFGLDNSMVAAAAAIVVATIMVRRVAAFPGARGYMYVVPSFASAFGVAAAAITLTRLGYNRLFLSSSFIMSLIVAFSVSVHLSRTVRRRFWVVPFGDTAGVRETPHVDWIIMREPVVPPDPKAILVADLHHDHDDAWERMLALAAVKGHEVYHTKVLMESLTGQVAMNHLSENSFGSLVPNLAYVRVKRFLDVVGVFALAPLLVPLMIVVGLAVKWTSPGPVFFWQERMGHRGVPFRMVKFRTMYVRDSAHGDAARGDAMTGDRDPRITSIGHLMRRTRMDELPQVWNILRGQMSWIGPRPEAIPLSRWYEGEIPFYLYRHIVRPGISGWAQVQQGHVTDLESVSAKLNYDFYYIKNFSSWLDILIVLKTFRTVTSGFGAR